MLKLVGGKGSSLGKMKEESGLVEERQREVSGLGLGVGKEGREGRCMVVGLW